MRQSLQKRRKALKRQHTAIAKAKKAGDPTPVQRKPRHRKRPSSPQAAGGSLPTPAPVLDEIPAPAREVSDVFSVSDFSPSWMPPMSWLPEVEELEELVEEVDLSCLPAPPMDGLVLDAIAISTCGPAPTAQQRYDNIRNGNRTARAMRIKLEFLRGVPGGHCSCDGRNRVGPESVRCWCSLTDGVRVGCVLGPQDADHSPGALPLHSDPIPCILTPSCVILTPSPHFGVLFGLHRCPRPHGADAGAPRRQGAGAVAD